MTGDQIPSRRLRQVRSQIWLNRRLEPCVAWDDGKLRPVRLIPDHLRAPYEEAAS